METRKTVLLGIGIFFACGNILPALSFWDAAQFGNLNEIVRYVEAVEIDVNKTDPATGRSALELATMSAYPEVMGYLLDHGANIAQKSVFGDETGNLLVAVLLSSDPPLALEILASRGLDLKAPVTVAAGQGVVGKIPPLAYFCARVNEGIPAPKRQAMMALMLKAGADPNAMPVWTGSAKALAQIKADRFGGSLYACANRGLADLIPVLVAGGADPALKNGRGQTALAGLFEAAISGGSALYPAGIRALVKAGARTGEEGAAWAIWLIDSDGVVSSAEKIGCFEALLESGVKPDAKATVKGTSWTPFARAVWHGKGNPEESRALIEAMAKRPNANGIALALSATDLKRPEGPFLPAITKAVLLNDSAGVKALVKSGEDPSTEAYEGLNAIGWAILLGREEVAAYFAKTGFINGASADVFALASRMGRQAILAALLDSFPNLPQATSDGAFVEALASGQTDVAEYLATRLYAGDLSKAKETLFAAKRPDCLNAASAAFLREKLGFDGLDLFLAAATPVGSFKAGQSGGPNAVWKDRLLLGTGATGDGRITSFDLSDPMRPKKIKTSSRLDYWPTKMQIMGDVLIYLDGSGNLSTMNPETLNKTDYLANGVSDFEVLPGEGEEGSSLAYTTKYSMAITDWPRSSTVFTANAYERESSLREYDKSRFFAEVLCFLGNDPEFFCAGSGNILQVSVKNGNGALELVYEEEYPNNLYWMGVCGDWLIVADTMRVIGYARREGWKAGEGNPIERKFEFPFDHVSSLAAISGERGERYLLASIWNKTVAFDVSDGTNVRKVKEWPVGGQISFLEANGNMPPYLYLVSENARILGLSDPNLWTNGAAKDPDSKLRQD